MNLLGVSTLTDLGPNSTLPYTNRFGELMSNCALHLASLYPSLLSALEDAGYKGQRGLGGATSGQLEELLICFPH